MSSSNVLSVMDPLLFTTTLVFLSFFLAFLLLALLLVVRPLFTL